MRLKKQWGNECHRVFAVKDGYDDFVEGRNQEDKCFTCDFYEDFYKVVAIFARIGCILKCTRSWIIETVGKKIISDVSCFL